MVHCARWSSFRNLVSEWPPTERSLNNVRSAIITAIGSSWNPFSRLDPYSFLFQSAFQHLIFLKDLGNCDKSFTIIVYFNPIFLMANYLQISVKNAVIIWHLIVLMVFYPSFRLIRHFEHNREILINGPSLITVLLFAVWSVCLHCSAFCLCDPRHH